MRQILVAVRLVAVRLVAVRLVAVRLVAVMLVAGGCLGVTPACAHPLDPALLELRQGADGRVEVLWRVPSAQPRGASLRPVLPESCRQAESATVSRGEQRVSARWTVDCGAESWVGARVGVEGLRQRETDALVRVHLADGRRLQAVLRGDEPYFTVPERAGPVEVFGDYLALGFEHILGGLDHLAFVLGLLLLVQGPLGGDRGGQHGPLGGDRGGQHGPLGGDRGGQHGPFGGDRGGQHGPLGDRGGKHSRRRLFWTITAFTAGHSVTLSLASLGVVRVPSAPVEVLIAVSILVVAMELSRPAEARLGWSWTSPQALAFGFGLLHGLGFAGALTEVGLPSGEIPVALFSFNCGIELGQLLFVGVLLTGGSVLGGFAIPRILARAPTYAIGGLASFWALDRTWSLF